MTKKSSIVVSLAGGLGNCLWQICGAYSCRPEEEHDLKFTADGNAARNALTTFVKKERYVHYGAYTAPIGYWQNTKWLLPPDIVRERILSEDVTAHARKEVDVFPLIVHVRGGDFLRSAAHQSSRATQQLIDKAVDACPGLSHKDVAIVTDDLQYVGETFGQRYPVLGDKGDARVAFHTLCCAKNLLISPGSTFSWWAAYLGKHERVLFPSRVWPQDIGALDYDLTSCTSGRDLVPDSCREMWTILDV